MVGRMQCKSVKEQINAGEPSIKIPGLQHLSIKASTFVLLVSEPVCNDLYVNCIFCSHP